MLYNAEVLLGMYAVTGGIYHVIPNMPKVIVPLIVSLLTWWWSDADLSIVPLVVLALVANGIHWIVLCGLQRIVKTGRTRPSFVTLAKCFVAIFMVLQVIVSSICCVLDHSILFLSPLPAFFVSSIVFLPILSLWMLTTGNVHDRNPRDVTFLTLFLPVLPCLVAGKFVMIAWSVVSDFHSMKDLSRFLWRIGLPIFLQSLFSRRVIVHDTVGSKETKRSLEWLLACLQSLAIMAFAPYMLRTGGGYVVGYYVACLAWIDQLVQLVLFVATKWYR